QLADELAAALADGTLPAELGVGQVWVQTSGRLQLLDTPVRPGPGCGDAGHGPEAAALALLRQSARLALEGRRGPPRPPPGVAPGGGAGGGGGASPPAGRVAAARAGGGGHAVGPGRRLPGRPGRVARAAGDRERRPPRRPPAGRGPAAVVRPAVDVHGGAAL